MFICVGGPGPSGLPMAELIGDPSAIEFIGLPIGPTLIGLPIDRLLFGPIDGFIWPPPIGDIPPIGPPIGDRFGPILPSGLMPPMLAFDIPDIGLIPPRFVRCDIGPTPPPPPPPPPIGFIAFIPSGCIFRIGGPPIGLCM